MRKFTTIFLCGQNYSNFKYIFIHFCEIYEIFIFLQSFMIGVFDSGFGGLTILRDIRCLLPQYDYLYLGDNARTPYGSRSYEVVYEYTLQAVRYLFEQGCRLIILACNTASAKALRTIQQKDLPLIDSQRRVLGIIRPTVEAIGRYTQSGHVGVMATEGTVASGSYPMEIRKIDPSLIVTQQACPMLVPLVENNEFENEGADYFVRKYLNQLLISDPKIDTILLACTHYPLLQDKILAELALLCNSADSGYNNDIKLLSQGQIVALSLKDYLARHVDLESTCSKGGTCIYLTTESTSRFEQSASIFIGEKIDVKHVEL